MKESLLQKDVCQFLDCYRYCYWRNYVGPIIRHTGVMTKNPMAGLPDIIGTLKNGSGRMFAIELKSSIGKLSMKQKWWLNRLQESGVPVLVATELHEVIDFLTVIEKKV